MPRSPRIHAPGAMYHVTLRGNHRQDIFFTRDDRSLLTRIVRDAIADCGAQLHAYCYMTNHVHALLQVSDTPLSKIMLLVAGRYARAVQARLQTTGHLFEKRYHALLVDADDYLLTLLRYIHLNPVRANLASSPDEYPWSSHHAYLGRCSEPWVTTEFALRMLGSDSRHAIAAYESFVRSVPASSPLLERNEHDPRILGGGERSTERHEMELFALHVARTLDGARTRHEFDRLVLIAAPRMLGLLRDALPAACRSVVAAEVPKDFVRHDIETIREAVPRAAFLH